MSAPVRILTTVRKVTIIILFLVAILFALITCDILFLYGICFRRTGQENYRKPPGDTGFGVG